MKMQDYRRNAFASFSISNLIRMIAQLPTYVQLLYTCIQEKTCP